MGLFSTNGDDIIDGDKASSIGDKIRWNESKTQLAFAKIIVLGALLTFLVLTGFAVYFICIGNNEKLSTLTDFTVKWFSPLWAIVGGVITYFFPGSK